MNYHIWKVSQIMSQLTLNGHFKFMLQEAGIAIILCQSLHWLQVRILDENLTKISFTH